MKAAAISGVILAGGQASRMGGADKGLLRLQQRPLIAHVLARLAPQVAIVAINANRNLEQYRQFDLPLFCDQSNHFDGPLAGISSALQQIQTPLLLCVPCDTPWLPEDLAERLYTALQQTDADVAIAFDGQRSQYLFMLLKRELAASLHAFLQRGGRAVRFWLAEQQVTLCDFSDQPEAFRNINTPAELQHYQRK